jgi:diguanylate cyclase (GGDEF)-like protein
MSLPDSIPHDRLAPSDPPSMMPADRSASRPTASADLLEELERVRAERRVLEQELTRVKAELMLARELALHDPLTGLPNRTLFLERLEHGIRQARRHGWTVAVLFIDLDDFKRINDTHGHDVGDEVLAAAARCLQSAVRAEDTICRYGGDEFACLLLNVQAAQDARRFATNLERRLHEACAVGEQVSQLNASIGVALYPEHARTADALLRHADTAMYRSKGTTTRVVVYEPECAD